MRASKKLRNDELLVTSFAPTRLRMELDGVPLWRGDQCSDPTTGGGLRPLSLPAESSQTRSLAGRDTRRAGLLTWEKDSFAYADSYDEDAGRYRGLRGGQQVLVVDADSPGLLVKSEIARKQIDAETTPPEADTPVMGRRQSATQTRRQIRTAKPPEAAKPKRFHGTVELDPTRVGRDAGRIADEVISHLSGLVGANVR